MAQAPVERSVLHTSCSNKKGEQCSPFGVVAEWTGLEPATPGVTGRYSNQLNYHSARCYFAFRRHCQVVGAERLELPTYAL